MRQFTMHVFVPETDLDQVFQVLSDFPDYAVHSAAVRSIQMQHDSNPPTSSWDVNFRGGILRWIEEDVFRPEDYRIDFRQTEGDLEVFQGSWLVEAADNGAVIVFATVFDLGIPTLEDVLDPIAEEALEENILAICIGLFGPGTCTVSAHGEPSTDVPVSA